MRSAGIAIVAVMMCARIAAAAPQAADDAPQSNFFDAKGVKIHYLVQGTGEPVMLIHGLYSSAAINWRLPGTMAALAKEHQVIALDLPGHGQSDRPEADDAYGLQMVEDIVLLMDHLNVRKAHIVGYSLGGMIAMKFIVLHPDRARSCLLGGMGWLQEGSGLQRFWDNIPARNRGPVPPACLRSFGKFAITEEDLRGVKLPLEVLVGDHDPCKALYVDPLHRVRGDWPIVVIQDAGHLTCIAKEQFKDELVKWIEAHDGK